eukprot:292733-Chlamydomonas_euryale.AAC.1
MDGLAAAAPATLRVYATRAGIPGLDGDGGGGDRGGLYATALFHLHEYVRSGAPPDEAPACVQLGGSARVTPVDAVVALEAALRTRMPGGSAGSAVQGRGGAGAGGSRAAGSSDYDSDSEGGRISCAPRGAGGRGRGGACDWRGRLSAQVNGASVTLAQFLDALDVKMACAAAGGAAHLGNGYGAPPSAQLERACVSGGDLADATPSPRAGGCGDCNGGCGDGSAARLPPLSLPS